MRPDVGDLVVVDQLTSITEKIPIRLGIVVSMKQFRSYHVILFNMDRPMLFFANELSIVIKRYTMLMQGTMDET